MTHIARGAVNESGALFTVNGFIPNNATWDEDIYFTEAGVAYDLSDQDFKMTFRCDPESTSADITLSTDAGTLLIVADDNGDDRILRIAVPAGSLSSYEGDYIMDLASKDADDKVLLWAHGIVTFTPNPITF